MKVLSASGLARSVLLSGVALGGIAIAAPASAQDAAAAEDEGNRSEIVVTARKRDEDVQSVPIVINAFSAEDLAERNIQTLADLGNSTPGIVMNNIAGGNTQTIYIRGLAPGNTANDLNVEANVGVFIDGIYQTSRNTIDIISVLDVGQIEIAKGPQSALFGRSTFAGAMAISTGKPSRDLSGSLQVTAGVDEDYRIRGALSVPISDTLRARVAGGYVTYDGFGTNAGARGDNLGGFEKYAISGALEFEPSEHFRALLSGFVTHSEAEVSPVYGLPVRSLNCGNVNAATGIPLLFCGELQPQKVSDVSPLLKDTVAKNKQVSLTLEGRIKGVKATSVTGFTWADNRGTSDYDLTSGGTQFGVCTLGNATNPSCGTNFANAPYTRLTRVNLSIGTVERVRTFSQEIRIQSDNESPFQWILGGYYFNSRIPLAAGGLGADGAGLAANERLVQVNQLATPAATGVGPYDFTANIFLVPDSNLGQVFGNYSRASTKTFSIFGAVGYELGDFRFNAEARYNSDVKQAQVFSISNPTSAPRINQLINGTTIPAAGTFPVIGPIFKRTFNSFTPRFTLDYRPTEDILLYASAAKGVRSGGFNTANPVSATGILASEVPYEEETNWTYEAGFKSRLFDRRVTINGSFFYVDWKDAQISAFTQNPTAVNPVRIVQNAGALRAKGVEIQADWDITDMFSIGGSFIYSDPKFRPGAYDGSQIPQCRTGTTAATFGSAPGCPAIIAVPTANGGTQFVPTLEGLRPQRSVKTQWNLHAVANVPLSDDWAFKGRVDVNYSGPAFNNLINTISFGERTLVNARIGIESDRYSFSLWANNLLDETYVQNAINQPRAGFPSAFSIPEAYLGERRRFGVTAGVKF
ncbi:TonB-dependent receptor [Blastomonas sp. SL216]|uniref:TonB-dependent receptor n=1 Tax=Blastomonas sp. SL216 TaxID=2995169 RepID=UPI002376DC15|nr:TonB-dependent receptor [Blastomonas sp. SL216]